MYKDYNETREILENHEKDGLEDLYKYDEKSQALIKHLIYSKFSSEFAFSTIEEFEKTINYQPFAYNTIYFFKVCWIFKISSLFSKTFFDVDENIVLKTIFSKKNKCL